MKKLVVFLLLALFLYNQVGYFIAFKMLQQQARKEIKKKLKNAVPEGELAVFSFSTKEAAKLQWVKQDKEFIHNGNMYDIVRMDERGDSITFHCVNDEQEKQLFVDLEKHVYDHIAGHPKNKELKKTFAKDYFCEPAVTLLPDSYSIVRFTSVEQGSTARYSSSIILPPERA